MPRTKTCPLPQLPHVAHLQGRCFVDPRDPSNVCPGWLINTETGAAHFAQCER